jgi:outer membrane protein assembly factor BamA
MTDRGLLITAFCGTVMLAVISKPLHADDASVELDADTLEREQVTIDRIVLEKEDVFDLNNPKENNWFYRWANRLHIITKDHVITKQMLLAPGDAYSGRLAEETERILRSNQYFYDVSVQPVNRRDDKVDLLVKTKDVWTLNPGFSISRKGGENKTIVDIEEVNLLGRGQLIRAARTDDVDRVSKSIEFQDQHLGDTWMSMRALYADNSDGESAYFSLVRPFYALDTRWSAGGVVSDLEQRGILYDLGEKAAEFRHERQYYSAFGGWSRGLRNGWVRRYTGGVVYDENRFSEVPEPTLPAAIPADRTLVYPFVGIEILQDQYEKTSNRDQIQKTEDFLTGTRFSASIGWSDRSFGADRDALVTAASASRLFGELDGTALSLGAKAKGRLESGDAVNALLSVDARFSHRFNDEHSFFATLHSTYGHKLDLESPVELGGDTGLRGYPLRYQAGDSKFLLSLEHRVFWDWYPLRLFRVGGAVFADVGRTWGEHPLGGTELGWLRDVGVGLRFAPTRTSSRKIVHLDIAFPLDGDASIDEIQINLESKKSF